MTILDSIVEHKHREVRSRRKQRPLRLLRDQEFWTRRTVSLVESLHNGRKFSIIAEVKRSSPSSGVLSRNFDPANISLQYTQAGARGISVLTDERFFSGSIQDLVAVRNATALPVLRKDFVIDEYQLFEARAFGADAVLLIAAILDPFQLRDYFRIASELGLECLVEVHHEADLAKLDFDRMNLIGINNRDLRTFEVNLNTTLRLAPLLPTATVVSESGIRNGDDLKRLLHAGIKCALVGEHFMRSGTPGPALKQLLHEVDDSSMNLTRGAE